MEKPKNPDFFIGVDNNKYDINNGIKKITLISNSLTFSSLEVMAKPAPDADAKQVGKSAEIPRNKSVGFDLKDLESNGLAPKNWVTAHVKVNSVKETVKCPLWLKYKPDSNLEARFVVCGTAPIVSVGLYDIVEAE